MFVKNTFVVQNEMTTYKITPDFRVSNTKNEVLTNVFANFYEKTMSRISLKNLNLRRNSQVHFNIVLENKNVSFYLSFPTKFEDLVDSKLKSCWTKCALDKVDPTESLKVKTANTVGGELRLTNYNCFPISTDLSDTSHLTSLFQVLRAVKGDDKIVINITLEPMTRGNWYDIVQDESGSMKQGKEKIINNDIAQLVAKQAVKWTNEAIGLYIEYQLLPLEILLGMVNESGDEAFNIRQNDKEMVERYESLEQRGHTSSSSRFGRGEEPRRGSSFSKKNSDVFKTKITILSSSSDESKSTLNLLSIVESFKELHSENEFYLKELKHKQVISRAKEIMNLYVPTDKNCILSTKEVAKLMQLPPQKEQRDFKIKSISTLEVDMPMELIEGKVPLAITKQGNKEYVAYRPLDKSMSSLSTIAIGSQNAGKTTLMKRFAYEIYSKAHETNFIIDTIEDCKVAKACREVIPSKDRVDIALSYDDEDNAPSFSFNEISCQITEDMKPFKRLTLASDIAEQVQLIIENISDGSSTPLTDAMVRYLYSACVVAYIRPQAVLQDVFDILRVPQKRAKAIEYAKTTGCFEDGDTVFVTLEQLDKWVKKEEEIGIDEKGKPIMKTNQILTNADSLIVGINNRITQLEKVPYVKRMLKQKPNPNENFLKFIEQGKSIIISVPQHDFKSKAIRDMIASYYLSRLWLAVQSRKDNENANVCTIFMDEVYTIPASIKLLNKHVTEFRRHRLGLFTSCHHLGQFGKDTLAQFKASGGNYLFLQSTTEESYEVMKNDLAPFTYQDINELKPYHAIIRQRCGEGYTNYIARIPNFGEDISRAKANNDKLIQDKKKKTR